MVTAQVESAGTEVVGGGVGRLPVTENSRLRAGEFATKKVEDGGKAGVGEEVSLASGFEVTPVPTASPGGLAVDRLRGPSKLENTRK